MKILIISYFNLFPVNAGNRVRLFFLIDYLRKQGCEVYYLWLNNHLEGNGDAMKDYFSTHFFEFSIRRQRFVKKKTRCIRGLNLKFIKYAKYNPLNNWIYNFNVDRFYPPGLNNYLRELNQNLHFDVVQVEYVFYSKAFDVFDKGTRKVIDTHDVFTNRYLRFLQQKTDPFWFSTNRKNEKKGLDRADAVLAIQEEEAMYMKSITSSLVLTVELNIPYRGVFKENFEGKILFLASSNPINDLAYKSLVQELYPILKKSNLMFEIIVAGHICDYVERVDGIVYLGEVDDLQSLYNAVDIAVNPTSFGTGLKIKSIEAIAYGRPLIAHKHALLGVGNAENVVALSYESPEGFLAAFRKMSIPNYWRSMQAQTLQYIQEYNARVEESLTSAYF